MFGKFWRGEDDVDRRGRPLPVPPVNFISIRPAVPVLDARLLQGQDPFDSVIGGASDDDGAPVLLDTVKNGAFSVEDLKALNVSALLNLTK